MRSQAERDQQTVTIARSLAIVVGILLVGVVVGWMVDASTGLSDGAASGLTLGTMLLAGAAGLVFIVRHRHS